MFQVGVSPEDGPTKMTTSFMQNVHSAATRYKPISDIGGTRQLKFETKEAFWIQLEMSSTTR